MKKVNSKRPSKKYGVSSRETLTDRSLSSWTRAFVKRFQNSLAEKSLLPRRSKILVAVSGGPDSVCLLALLNILAKRYEWQLHVAHVNYGLRGRDSERDENSVRSLAKYFDTPLFVFHPRLQPKNNIEARLRSARYKYFEELRRKIGFDLIATAHTKNDVAETLLLNLLRGAGPRGLSPFLHQPPGIVRPLLTVTREEVLRFLEEEQLSFREDKSNRDEHFTRNRIRHRLLPFLVEEFNPRIIKTLAETARSCTQSDQISTKRSLVQHPPGNRYRIDRAAFLLLSSSDQHAFLSHFLSETLGQSPSAAFIRELHKAIMSEKRKTRIVTRRELKMSVTRATIDFTLRGKDSAFSRPCET